MSPQQYIDWMATEYEQMFGTKPHTRVTSPLEKNDHPETDDSELLDESGVQRYQSLIGSLQWAAGEIRHHHSRHDNIWVPSDPSERTP